jgi:hypothetical protein
LLFRRVGGLADNRDGPNPAKEQHMIATPSPTTARALEELHDLTGLLADAHRRHELGDEDLSLLLVDYEEQIGVVLRVLGWTCSACC